MNFFGHAVVASWVDASPGFVLGAMLPDLAAMVGARAPTTHHLELRHGIDFHHRTDEVFHDSLAFRQLAARGAVELASMGLGRGSARAGAHVGLEIQIDSELAIRPGAQHPYENALTSAATLARSLVWPARSQLAFLELCSALRRRGVSPRHSDPPQLARRIEYTLSRRPRLALRSCDLAPLAVWAGRVRPHLACAMPGILETLETGLRGH